MMVLLEVAQAQSFAQRLTVGVEMLTSIESA
jgi:hypothetical protein